MNTKRRISFIFLIQILLVFTPLLVMSCSQKGEIEGSKGIIGEWKDTSSPFNTYKIYKENNEYFLDIINDEDASDFATIPLIASSNLKHFDRKESTRWGDYYEIFLGDLEIRDSEGLISVAKKKK